MDATPAIVIEADHGCASAELAQGWVRESMRGTMSPRGEWTVRVTSVSPLHFVGALEDEEHRPVAHRDLYARSAKECAGTMHAVGVWASLVLDAELLKAHEMAQPAVAPSERTAAPVDAEAEPAPAPLRPAPAPLEPGRVELGLSTSLGAGVGGASATYVGVGLFMFVDVWRRLSVRPSVNYSRSLDSPTSDSGHARVDACARTAGQYMDRQGLQLDLCVGPEGGVMTALGADQTMHLRPRFGVGPAVSLRGDLASALAVEVRGACSYNFVRGESGDLIAPLSLRGELSLSWGAR